MIDRKSLRDIGLAVLLALPAATLARPPAHATSGPSLSNAATQLTPAAPQRFDLPR